jgi:hypothetical protein
MSRVASNQPAERSLRTMAMSRSTMPLQRSDSVMDASAGCSDSRRDAHAKPWAGGVNRAVSRATTRRPRTTATWSRVGESSMTTRFLDTCLSSGPMGPTGRTCILRNDLRVHRPEATTASAPVSRTRRGRRAGPVARNSGNQKRCSLTPVVVELAQKRPAVAS